jgi:hypothetical protein
MDVLVAVGGTEVAVAVGGTGVGVAVGMAGVRNPQANIGRDKRTMTQRIFLFIFALQFIWSTNCGFSYKVQIS